VNHGLVADLRGGWRKGKVRGELHPQGTGRWIGWPLLVPNESASEIDVEVLDSAELPAHWDALDRFEGPAYRRVLVIVDCGTGLEVANLYAEA
jgi:hypothetical protein